MPLLFSVLSVSLTLSLLHAEIGSISEMASRADIIRIVFLFMVLSPYIPKYKYLPGNTNIGRLSICGIFEGILHYQIVYGIEFSNIR